MRSDGVAMKPNGKNSSSKYNPGKTGGKLVTCEVNFHVPARQAWQPLQGEFFKLNFDGVCFDNGASSGYGAVIHNGNGEVMATISAKGGAVRDSEELEVMACRKALEFAINASFMDVILEGDNALVMETVSQA
ncbi:hypothetical protein SO802_022359 [Lithocarpus litseifolius]|uniref:RNase H type-1 domain-containing protein n=1 Tax=Lithocarpus litseifolius TaxID=425828 RepID=A0AAW2CHV8_9ROSI